jgi:hypothetical protein
MIPEQEWKKLRLGVRVLEWEVDKCRRLFYDRQASMQKDEQRYKHEKKRTVVVVIIQKYMCKWLVMHAYLKSLSSTISI